MEIKKLIPNMWSNIDPAPYMASASSEFSSEYRTYKAFNGTYDSSEDGWLCQTDSVSKEEYIQIATGNKVKVHSFSIRSRNGSPVFHPVKFKLLVSNDGTAWEEVFITETAQAFSSNEVKEYTLDSPSECRYIRLTITEHYPLTAGAIRTFISEFEIFGEEMGDGRLSINKTLKANLPSSVESGRDELHFTEDGGIYINDKDGNLVPCNTGNIFMEISNPLSTNPLEHGYIKINEGQTIVKKGSIASLTNISGNLLVDENAITLKQGVSYYVSISINAKVKISGGLTYALKDLDTDEIIGELMKTLTVTHNEHLGRANSINFEVVPTKDMKVSLKFLDADLEHMIEAGSIIIQEIRSNPVNQYGGFQTEVLFEGIINSIGDYVLSDDVNSYNHLYITSGGENGSIRYSLPPMTSETTPSPLTITYSSLYSGYTAWGPFNQKKSNTYDCWCSNETTGWLKIDTGENTDAVGIFLAGRTYDSYTMQNWKLEGSNDDSEWVEIIASQGAIPPVGKVYNFQQKVNFRYYKISGTGTNGGVIILGSFDLIGAFKEEIKTDIVILSDSSTYLVDNENILLDIVENTMSVLKYNSKKNMYKVVGIKGQLPSLLVGGEF